MAAPDESDEADEENECDCRELLPPVILGGKLALAAEDPPRQTLGMFAAARALSAETCELCGGKGDPVAGVDGQPAGCRCSRCREPGGIVLARDWDWATLEDHPQSVSPGQPEEGWQSRPRLDTHYAELIRQLMATEHEDDVMSLWALGSGWAGLIRALFILLRPEQDERPDDPERAPFRLARINEKWGLLDIRSAGYTTRYQRWCDRPDRVHQRLGLLFLRPAGRSALCVLGPAGLRLLLGAGEPGGACRP